MFKFCLVADLDVSGLALDYNRLAASTEFAVVATTISSASACRRRSASVLILSIL